MAIFYPFLKGDAMPVRIKLHNPGGVLFSEVFESVFILCDIFIHVLLSFLWFLSILDFLLIILRVLTFCLSLSIGLTVS